MYKTLTRYTLLISFILGVFLGVCLYRDKNVNHIKKKIKLSDSYEKWFQEQHLKRTIISKDILRYGSQKYMLESNFLYDKINLLCVLLVRKRKNSAAAIETWGKQCNDRMLVYIQKEEKIQKKKLPIQQVKLQSSWHLLCDAIRKINDTVHWALFVNDDTFALPENVRRMVAALNHNEGHYLGHAITFWGVQYNIAQAGYILSKGSIRLLQKRFNSTEECISGGRFWKQEDYYLGKHLASFDIRPADTRDSQGLTTFHGHSLAQLVTPGSISSLALSNYYSRSVFPAEECCSPYAVTFQTIEADKMYTNHYLLYQLDVFEDGGSLGNQKSQIRIEDDEKVWKAFVHEQLGELANDVSPEVYFNLWKNVVNDPINFNSNIRKWSASVTNITELQLSKIRRSASKISHEGSSITHN